MASRLCSSTKTAGIYILYCKNLSVKDEYVGKSVDIYSRINNHKSDCNSEVKKKSDTRLYNFMRQHGGFKEWEFSVLEVCPRDIIDKKEMSEWLTQAEIKWIKRLEPTLNTQHSSSYKCVKPEARDDLQNREDLPPQYSDVVAAKQCSSAKRTLFFTIMAVLWLRFNAR
jgi:hypothetical protein